MNSLSLVIWMLGWPIVSVTFLYDISLAHTWVMFGIWLFGSLFFCDGTSDDIAESDLTDLIEHMIIHSGYPNCGRDQMTTAQKELFDGISDGLKEEA